MPPSRKAPAKPPPPPDQDVLELDRMLSTQSDPDWKVVAPVAKRILTKVGIGKIKGSATQVSALKEIILRAEGRLGVTKPEDDDAQVVHVICLPYLDNPEPGKILDLGDIEESS